MRSCSIVALVSLFAGLGLSGAATTETASAGTYPVTACTGSTPLINKAWQSFNNGGYLETRAHCGSEDVTEGSPITSGLAAADVLELSTNVPAGAMAGWRFTAPVGDTIGAIGIDRDLYRQSEGWAPQIVEADGHPLPGESCSPYGACEVSGEAVHTGLDTTSLAIELVCEPPPGQPTVCVNGFSQHSARVELNSATVTVTDEQPPQITSTSGSLFAGGVISGTLSGTIDGSDNSGVQYARVFVDGAQVAQQTLTCNFTLPAPCPATSSSQLSLDTTALANGLHRIQAAVVDAAGNQTLGIPIQVTVDNPGPTIPAAQPIAGALLDVTETPADEGAKTMPLAGVRTGPTGAWALTLPRGISSSTLRIAYRSHLDDPAPAATATLRLRVHAGIELRIAPRVTSVGRSIFFSGALHGAPIPPGKQLVLEASSGGEWIQFDTISTTAKGRYRASYRFRFPGPVTYRFRVISPYEADFPFLDGASNVVDVHER